MALVLLHGRHDGINDRRKLKSTKLGWSPVDE